MNITFTFAEMKSCLEKLGYELRLDTEDDLVFEDEKWRVWNAYANGKLITTPEQFPRLYGTHRLERLFQDLLKEKLLRLF